MKLAFIAGCSENHHNESLAGGDESRGTMRLSRITPVFFVLLSTAAMAGDLEADVAQCHAFETERTTLVASGVDADMAKGPEWARANLPANRMQQIMRYIHVDEQLKFRCPEVFATAAVKAEEERARQEALEAKRWAERLAEFAKNPMLPERKPVTMARAKPQPAPPGPPLPERATR